MVNFYMQTFQLLSLSILSHASLYRLLFISNTVGKRIAPHVVFPSRVYSSNFFKVSSLFLAYYIIVFVCFVVSVIGLLYKALFIGFHQLTVLSKCHLSKTSLAKSKIAVSSFQAYFVSVGPPQGNDHPLGDLAYQGQNAKGKQANFWWLFSL